MPSAVSLRGHLGTTLPDYMVPRQFVALTALPLLPNGKIDRRSLPAPGHDDTGFEDDFVEPTGPMEVLIAEAWSDLLNVDRISTTDNFFNLGGHSLLAMRAINAVHERTGVRLSPRRFIFETLGQLGELGGPAAADDGRSSAGSDPQPDAGKPGVPTRVERLLGRIARMPGAARRRQEQALGSTGREPA